MACRVAMTKAPNAGNVKWMKPNINASFSTQLNKLGLGLYIRDGTCTLVLEKIEWFSPICDVKI